jgi:hypothetical protein
LAGINVHCGNVDETLLKNIRPPTPVYNSLATKMETFVDFQLNKQASVLQKRTWQQTPSSLSIL